MPVISVSVGELIDKITILEIKETMIKNEDALLNIRTELAVLNKVHHDVKQELIVALKCINLELWNVEDSIREHEKDRNFDATFIDLARSVYYMNDDRARVKKKINVLHGSDIIEEKSYAKY